MQVECPHCRRVLGFAEEPPCFCAYCGKRLAGEDPEAAVEVPGPAVDPDRTADLPAHPRALADTPPPPPVVGRYKLLRELGKGGMGTVYEAEATTGGRRVALKLISPEFVGSRDAVERFRQEGRLASRVTHPRCVFVFGADEDAGRPYIVMELMPGRTLQDLVEEEGPLAPREAVERVMDVIEGSRRRTGWGSSTATSSPRTASSTRTAG